MAQFTVEAAVWEGITRLDKDIADAQARVAQAQERLDEEQGVLVRLQAMRENAMPFIQQYVSHEARVAHQGLPADGGPSFVDEVLEVFRQQSGIDLDVDQVWKILQENGSHQDKDRVRNSINYARRLGKIERGLRRGTYTHIDTSTPVAAGVDVGEEPNAEGSSGEIGGGRDEPSAPPHDQGGGANDARIHLGRVGDRAPIVG
jgi:hypothetical protein